MATATKKKRRDKVFIVTKGNNAQGLIYAYDRRDANAQRNAGFKMALYEDSDAVLVALPKEIVKYIRQNTKLA